MAWKKLLVVALFFVLPQYVRAEYVLPYPSYMPGNKLYRFSRLIDRIRQPFYFGNISSYKYHLSLADKYLVEAKTLFEYKQYLLATDALARSDAEFAIAKRKVIRNFVTQFQEASRAHQVVLNRLQKELPEQFLWTPEKDNPTSLPLKDLINTSITIRTLR